MVSLAEGEVVDRVVVDVEVDVVVLVVDGRTGSAPRGLK